MKAVNRAQLWRFGALALFFGRAAVAAGASHRQSRPGLGVARDRRQAGCHCRADRAGGG